MPIPPPVACSVCGAQPGQPCNDLYGYPRAVSHLNARFRRKRLKALTGDGAGQHSIRINDQ